MCVKLIILWTEWQYQISKIIDNLIYFHIHMIYFYICRSIRWQRNWFNKQGASEIECLITSGSSQTIWFQHLNGSTFRPLGCVNPLTPAENIRHTYLQHHLQAKCVHTVFYRVAVIFVFNVHFLNCRVCRFPILSLPNSTQLNCSWEWQSTWLAHTPTRGKVVMSTHNVIACYLYLMLLNTLSLIVSTQIQPTSQFNRIWG